MTAEAISKRASLRGLIRRALITVPAILLLGMLSGRLANSGYGNPWFEALSKPKLMPPGWVFPVAWSTLYILLGVALALILDAPRSRARSVAIALFLIQLGLNLSWSPVFFALHRIMFAFGIILAMLLWATAATILCWRVRRAAGLLMLPYLAWLVFAATLNWRIHELNPHGVTLVPMAGDTQIIIE